MAILYYDCNTIYNTICIKLNQNIIFILDFRLMRYLTLNTYIIFAQIFWDVIHHFPTAEDILFQSFRLCRKTFVPKWSWVPPPDKWCLLHLLSKVYEHMFIGLFKQNQVKVLDKQSVMLLLFSVLK